MRWLNVLLAVLCLAFAVYHPTPAFKFVLIAVAMANVVVALGRKPWQR